MKSIILLHGALGSKQQMLPLANRMSDNFDVHTFDFSGHDEKSSSNIIFSIEKFADDLEEYIHEHNLNHPMVFGYSMGGYVALYHAYLNPGKIETIITLATKMDWSPETSEKEVLQLNVERMKAAVPEFVEMLISRHGAYWENLVMNTADMMLQLGNHKLLNENMLGQIQTKVTLCIGDKDRMVSIAETENAAKNLAMGNCMVMENTPHPFERVNYEKLAEIIVCS